jgi:hypothetical protein
MRIPDILSGRKMLAHIKVLCFFAFMLYGTAATPSIAQNDVNGCPISQRDRSIEVPLPQLKPVIFTRDKVYSVPRKQVLIEDFTNLG